jgi:hypothetical protein
VIASLRNAVSARPGDRPLRLHPASLLLAAGHRDEAVGHLGAVLQACESAAEIALLDSARTGPVRMIGQDDLLTGISQIRPSLGPRVDSARTVALFANEGGSCDDLAAYLKKRNMP